MTRSGGGGLQATLLKGYGLLPPRGINLYLQKNYQKKKDEFETDAKFEDLFDLDSVKLILKK